MFYTQQQQQFTTYQVLVSFCRQDFGNAGKVSATLEKIGKVSKFSDPVEQGAQKLWSWFSNFGSVATTVFSVQYVEAKIR